MTPNEILSMDANKLAHRLAVTSFGDIAELVIGLRAELDAATRQRDEMAAALEAARVQAHHTATTFTVWRRNGHFDAEAAEIWVHSDKEALIRAANNPSGILRDIRQKAAAWALRKNADELEPFSILARSAQVADALRSVVITLRERADALQRGDVEVPSET